MDEKNRNWKNLLSCLLMQAQSNHSSDTMSVISDADTGILCT